MKRQKQITNISLSPPPSPLFHLCLEAHNDEHTHETYKEQEHHEWVGEWKESFHNLNYLATLSDEQHIGKHRLVVPYDGRTAGFRSVVVDVGHALRVQDKRHSS